MSPAASILALLLACATGGVGGTLWGQHLERKNQDASTVAELQAVLTANSDLVKRSTEASSSIRQAVGRLHTITSKTSKGISDELQATASDRAGCVFPAGVMRVLSEARNRAAAAAAHGIVDTVPPATSGTTAER